MRRCQPVDLGDGGSRSVLQGQRCFGARSKEGGQQPTRIGYNAGGSVRGEALIEARAQRGNESSDRTTCHRQSTLLTLILSMLQQDQTDGWEAVTHMFGAS
jgi:hypothetical protein